MKYPLSIFLFLNSAARQPICVHPSELYFEQHMISLKSKILRDQEVVYQFVCMEMAIVLIGELVNRLCIASITPGFILDLSL